MIDLAAIRARNEERRKLPDQENARPFQGWQPPFVVVQAADDIETLLAEVERLRVALNPLPETSTEAAMREDHDEKCDIDARLRTTRPIEQHGTVRICGPHLQEILNRRHTGLELAAKIRKFNGGKE